MTEIGLVLLVSMVSMLLLVGLTIYLVYVFYSSKTKLLKKTVQLENEVSKSKNEIHEEYMKHIGKELHDNIGQLLSAAKLQLNMSPYKSEIADSIEIIGESLSEIRSISKRIDPDAINNMGLVDSASREIERLDRVNGIDAQLQVAGDEYEVDSKDEIILFRIIQESLSNLIKHARANQVSLTLSYEPQHLLIILKDNGVGFVADEVSGTGSGLRNMKQRAQMIDAELVIRSAKEKGTTTTIVYPNNH